MNQPITNPAYPLSWPAGRPRTPAGRRQRSPFRVPSLAAVRDELVNEMRLLGARQVVLSTNLHLRRDGLPAAGQRQPEDPGVAVYFIDRKGRQMAFACDRWEKVEDNVRAVQKTIEALRGVERWGSGEMLDAAFTGFQALPAARPWWEVLGVPAHTPTADVHLAYRRAIMAAHPDRGGSTERAQEVEAAYAAFKQERGLG